MIRIALTLLCLALLAPLSAQSRRTRSAPPAPRPSTSAATGWPVETIAVEGNENFKAGQILSAAGLRVGATLGKKELDAARQRLLDTGAFGSAGYSFEPAKDGKGIDVQFQVVEVTALYPPLFEDLPGKDGGLRAWMTAHDPLFGGKISGAQASLDRYKALASEYLKAHGFSEPISVTVASEAPPELVVLFRPQTARPAVSFVHFVNPGDVPPEDLQSAVAETAIGTGYSETALRQVLDASVKPLYEARGRLAVAFPKIETGAAKDTKGLDVTVDVEQGPVYKLGKVTFAGTDTPSKELEKIAGLNPGDTANMNDVNAATSQLIVYLKRLGYMEAKVDVKRGIEESKHSVDLLFTLHPGAQFTFGKLNIEGLDIISEPEIRKMWGLKEGKPFNPEYPESFLEILKEERTLENLKSAKSQLKLNAAQGTVDVTLTFK